MRCNEFYTQLPLNNRSSDSLTSSPPARNLVLVRLAGLRLRQLMRCRRLYTLFRWPFPLKPVCCAWVTKGSPKAPRKWMPAPRLGPLEAPYHNVESHFAFLSNGWTCPGSDIFLNHNRLPHWACPGRLCVGHLDTPESLVMRHHHGHRSQV